MVLSLDTKLDQKAVRYSINHTYLYYVQFSMLPPCLRYLSLPIAQEVGDLDTLRR